MLISFSHCNSKKEKLDIKLDEIFDSKKNGFFIELGANNGLTQSNTAFFEKYRNWSGILIEPSRFIGSSSIEFLCPINCISRVSPKSKT